MPHISLAAETIFHLGDFSVTNSLLVSVLLTVFLSLFSFFATQRLSLIPRGVQNHLEAVIEPLYNLSEQVVGNYASVFFPLAATFFFFIILGNWSGLVPGVGSIGFFEMEEGHRVLVPFLRGATADLNTTLALALFSVGAIQFYGLSLLKFQYLKRFFNLKTPIDLFVGILELFSDVAKIISFSFRLFGNVFAGEVLLVVMAFLVPFLVPFPFLILEVFVGFIQALIFTTLTLVFLNVATAGHHE